MTNEKILTKAIKKAVKGGWEKYGWPIWSLTYSYGIVDGIRFTDKKDNLPVYCSIPEIVFSHSFARAFWGTETDFEAGMMSEYPIENWQYHLQQMVLCDDPIKYLEGFL